jgi:hypothetical protein
VKVSVLLGAAAPPSLRIAQRIHPKAMGCGDGPTVETTEAQGGRAATKETFAQRERPIRAARHGAFTTEAQRHRGDGDSFFSFKEISVPSVPQYLCGFHWGRSPEPVALGRILRAARPNQRLVVQRHSEDGEISKKEKKKSPSPRCLCASVVNATCLAGRTGLSRRRNGRQP